MRLHDLGSSPEEVLAWLDDVRAGRVDPPVPPTDVNPWLGLIVEVKSRDKKASLAWGRVAIALYDYLDEHRPPQLIPLGELSLDAMFHRVLLMRRFGVVAGDDVLDPRGVAEWVRGALDLPVHEAVERARTARAWIASGDKADHSHPVATEVRRLRWIKNRLAVARELARVPGVELDDDLQAWVIIRDQLP
jgi:hypothetical protein